MSVQTYDTKDKATDALLLAVGGTDETNTRGNERFSEIYNGHFHVGTVMLFGGVWVAFKATRRGPEGSLRLERV